jgi:hypothetical protein
MSLMLGEDAGASQKIALDARRARQVDIGPIGMGFLGRKSTWSTFGDPAEALHIPWLPAQPLLPNEDAAHNRQNGYADHQHKPVDYCMFVTVSH